MAYKPFNQLLHDACDPPARVAVSDWIQMKWGGKCIENPNKYAVDLIVHKNDQKVAYAEVEVRNWGQKYCPYDTIHIAQRKEKLFNNDLKTLMFVVTHDFQHAYWITADKVKAAPLMEIPNKAVQKDEWFYDVPMDQWKLVDLTEPF